MLIIPKQELNKVKNEFGYSLALLISLQWLPAFVIASETETGAKAATYSPPVNTTHATHVYWGDSHLHTGLSLDAGLFGCTLGPDDAYRLARGEQITASSGLPVQLARPLDWMVVTDHSDLMGIATDIKKGHLISWPIRKVRNGMRDLKRAAGRLAKQLLT